MTVDGSTESQQNFNFLRSRLLTFEDWMVREGHHIIAHSSKTEVEHIEKNISRPISIGVFAIHSVANVFGLASVIEN